MKIVRIEGADYDVDAMSTEAKERLQMLVATDRRLRELELEAAIHKTARLAYLSALKAVLPPGRPVAEEAAAPLPPAVSVDDGIFKF